jgi:hypothetical protein
MVNGARKAIESLYLGRCSVYEYRSVTDPVTKIAEPGEVPVLTNQPCRLSYKTITGTSPDGGAATVAQTVKLFIASEITIKPGSKITVTQNGVTADYQSSGQPAVYTSHQEIILELFAGWA